MTLVIALSVANASDTAFESVLPALPPKPEASTAVAAHAWRSEAIVDSKEYPEGTRHVVAGVRLAGLRLNHSEYHVPSGKDAKRRWDFAKIALPDGSTLIGNSLCWHSGNRGYSPWSFLRATGKLPAWPKAGDLLKPSVCVASAAFRTDREGSGELVFSRPHESGPALQVAVRMKRVAGDPWLYLRLHALGDGAELERISLGGYPNTTHPIFYSLRHRYPRNASFLLRERWLWVMGQHWNLHDRAQAHQAQVTSEMPGGVFFYNRHNSETGGMVAVFLPEQVTTIDARGTYGVSASLGLRQPWVRLALREWYDMRGWEAVLDELQAELNSHVERLRRMSFAWLGVDPLGKDTGRVAALLAMGSDEPLHKSYHEVRRAAERLRDIPPSDSPERFTAETRYIVAAGQTRDAMEPLLRQWLAKGGVFPSDPTE